MKPINFPQANVKLVGPQGENDPNVQPMAAHAQNGMFTSCWELTDEEIAELSQTKKIYVMVVSGQQGPPPINLQVSDPFIKHPLGYCILPFEMLDEQGEGTGQFIHVWNSRDGEVLETITIDGQKLKLNTSIPGFVPQAVIQLNIEMYKTTKYMFVDPTEAQIEAQVKHLLTRPETEWPQLVDKNGDVIPPPRNAEDHLKLIVKNIPILCPITLDSIAPSEPKPEKSGTGFDAKTAHEPIIKSINPAK